MEQGTRRNLGIVISIHNLKSLSSGYRFYSRGSLINRSINCSICLNQSINQSISQISPSIHTYIHPSIHASKHLTIQLPKKKSVVICPHPIIRCHTPSPSRYFPFPRDKEPRIVGTVWKSQSEANLSRAGVSKKNPDMKNEVSRMSRWPVGITVVVFKQIYWNEASNAKNCLVT